MPDLERATEFVVLALEPLVAPPEIDGTMLRRGHEPGAMGIGSRHGYPSHHLPSAGASPARRDDFFAAIRAREGS